MLTCGYAFHWHFKPEFSHDHQCDVDVSPLDAPLCLPAGGMFSMDYMTMPGCAPMQIHTSREYQ